MQMRLKDRIQKLLFQTMAETFVDELQERVIIWLLPYGIMMHK
jgi:hypothetical protein